MFGKRHRAAVVLGVLMGITAPMLAMIPSSHHTEAAVLVIDQRNIEEAIKTAIQTANILTQEEKQLALMILNSKKIDLEEIAKVMKPMQQRQSDILIDVGINKEAEEAARIWMDRVDDIGRISRGEVTVYDVINKEVKRHEAQAKQAKAAAKQAQKLEDRSANRTKQVQEAVQASNNAEGEDQLLQAGNHLAALDVENSIDANIAAANYYRAKIHDMQAENARRATAAAKDIETANEMRMTLNEMVKNGDISATFARTLVDPNESASE